MKNCCNVENPNTFTFVRQGVRLSTTHFSLTSATSISRHASCVRQVDTPPPRQTYLSPPEEGAEFAATERVTASLEHVSCRWREPTVTLIGWVVVVADAADAIASLATCENDTKKRFPRQRNEHIPKKQEPLETADVLLPLTRGLTRNREI